MNGRIETRTRSPVFAYWLSRRPRLTRLRSLRLSSPLMLSSGKRKIQAYCLYFSFAVGMRGLEPPRVAPYAPEAYAYTNSATCPYFLIITSRPLIGSTSLRVYNSAPCPTLHQNILLSLNRLNNRTGRPIPPHARASSRYQNCRLNAKITKK